MLNKTVNPELCLTQNTYDQTLTHTAEQGTGYITLALGNLDKL